MEEVLNYLIPISNLEGCLESNVGSNVGSNVRKKRMSEEEIRGEIFSLCDDWVSLEYIAKMIKRNSAYLLNHVIPSMLEEGLIERMFPESPRNPYQKYKRK